MTLDEMYMEVQARYSLPVLSYVVHVTIGVLLVIIPMAYFLTWSLRKKTRNIEAERQQVLAKCDTDLYITPIASERLLLIPPNEGVRMDHTTTSPNAHVEKRMDVLPIDCSPCITDYDMMPVSSNDDFQNKLHNNKSNDESHGSSTTPSQDASAYLTVEFVTESAV